MLKTKIVSLSLAGLMALGGLGVTALAADVAEVENSSITVGFDSEAKKNERDAKRDAKIAELLASGKTQEEVDAIMAEMDAKIAERDAKRKEHFEAKLAKGEEIQARKDAREDKMVEKEIKDKGIKARKEHRAKKDMENI